MAQLAEQFEEAKSRITPTADDVSHASEAHTQVRAALETSEPLRRLGIDTILIGSYARQVAIRRINDVDVFSKLLAANSPIAPGSLLQLFRNVLTAEFGAKRVELQDRSVKIEFPVFDLSVDAVPARPWAQHWAVPDRSGGWEETNPELLGTLTTKMNRIHDGHYVPTVKLIRQARRAQLGDAQPGGLYLEIATYHAFAEGLVASSASEYFCESLSGVATQLDRACIRGLADPTLPGHTISTRATEAELQRAARRFHDLARRAKAALKSGEACPAARTFREILGKTSDGQWAFPMPSYCNDDGTPRSTSGGVRRGSRTVPEGDRFA